ncbi:Hypothetical protein Cp3995_0516 [Corynebacterium pseudotuberculosis 3/99-5]|nr:Hypothetical protein Cp3995_0516 [Corynebacterium pseudotuberculosis 3/99-5]
MEASLQIRYGHDAQAAAQEQQRYARQETRPQSSMAHPDGRHTKVQQLDWFLAPHL